VKALWEIISSLVFYVVLAVLSSSAAVWFLQKVMGVFYG